MIHFFLSLSPFYFRQTPNLIEKLGVHDPIDKYHASSKPKQAKNETKPLSKKQVAAAARAEHSTGKAAVNHSKNQKGQPKNQTPHTLSHREVSSIAKMVTNSLKDLPESRAQPRFRNSGRDEYEEDDYRPAPRHNTRGRGRGGGGRRGGGSGYRR